MLTESYRLKKNRILDAHEAPWTCFWCRVELARGGLHRVRTADHLRPKSQGGTWDPANIVPACGTCNNVRQNVQAETFRAWLETPLGRRWCATRPHLRDVRRVRRILVRWVGIGRAVAAAQAAQVA